LLTAFSFASPVELITMDALCMPDCPSIRGARCDSDGPVLAASAKNQGAKKNQPQAYRRGWSFNCVLLQQSVKFD